MNIGDMGDASDTQRFKELQTGLVVNPCADRVSPEKAHAAVSSELTTAAIGQLVLHATDHRRFDMMSVAEHIAVENLTMVFDRHRCSLGKQAHKPHRSADLFQARQEGDNIPVLAMQPAQSVRAPSTTATRPTTPLD